MKHAGSILVVDDEVSIADGLRLSLEAEKLCLSTGGKR